MLDGCYHHGDAGKSLKCETHLTECTCMRFPVQINLNHGKYSSEYVESVMVGVRIKHKEHYEDLAVSEM